VQEGNFRSVVRDELVLWMEKNRGRFDLLTSRIMEAVAPVVAEQLERGILARLTTVQADEREQLGMLLEQARAFVSRYGLSTPNKIDQADVLLRDLDAGIGRLSCPPRTSPTGS
jgi:hypothetical protein